MEFLYPSFLWASLLISIPILVHLFYFRRYKKIQFTNVRFLQSIQEEQTTWRKIRNLFVLAMRILAVLFLVFAFAQPFIPKKEQQIGEKVMSIYIDNSFSMNSRAEEVSLFQLAIQNARQLIEREPPETQFLIVDNEIGPRSRRWVNREDALDLIEEIEITAVVSAFDKIQKFITSQLDETKSARKEVFYLSDFQKSTTSFTGKRDSTIRQYAVPLQSVVEENISIDSVWFSAPVQLDGEPSTLYMALQNYSDSEVSNVTVSLQDEQQTRPLGRISIPANGRIIDTVQYSPTGTGWQGASIMINDYPVQFDDTYYIAFNVPEKVSILAIYEKKIDPYLSHALDGIDNIMYRAMPASNINYTEISSYDCIVLQDIQEISTGLRRAFTDYISSGGNMILFPAFGEELQSYNSFLRSLGAKSLAPFVEEEAEVGRINQNAFLFSGVFLPTSDRLLLPKVTAYSKPIGVSSRARVPILQFRNGVSFLDQYQYKSGNLIVCYSPLSSSYNSLSRSGELFVPLLFRSALLGQQNEKLSYHIGINNIISARNRWATGDSDYRITGKKEFIPYQRIIGNEVQLDIKSQIQQAGLYQLEVKDSLDRLLAFNFNRKESDLSLYSQEELQTLAGQGLTVFTPSRSVDLGQKVEKEVADAQLWKWCILLVLLFLVIEQLILRFWKIE